MMAVLHAIPCEQYRSQTRAYPTVMICEGPPQTCFGRFIIIPQGASSMSPELKATILKILNDNRIMTLATLRPDGWPQATTVGFANDDLQIFFLCGADSQKASNLVLDDRVSATIDHDTTGPMAITGLSMAAHARRVRDSAEIARFEELLLAKYLEYRDMPMPEPGSVAFFALQPELISVLDYSKGFGHSELVRVEEEQLSAA
jgi:general stress protein 26